MPLVVGGEMVPSMSQCPTLSQMSQMLYFCYFFLFPPTELWADFGIVPELPWHPAQQYGRNKGSPLHKATGTAAYRCRQTSEGHPRTCGHREILCQSNWNMWPYSLFSAVGCDGTMQYFHVNFQSVDYSIAVYMKPHCLFRVFSVCVRHAYFGGGKGQDELCLLEHSKTAAFWRSGLSFELSAASFWSHGCSCLLPRLLQNAWESCDTWGRHLGNFNVGVFTFPTFWKCVAWYLQNWNHR